MTVTLERQIICWASSSPQGTVRSLRQLLPLLLQQLRSSGGRPSGGRRHSPPPRAGLRSPLEGAGQKPPGGTLPAPPGDFSDPELEERGMEEKTREFIYCELFTCTNSECFRFNLSIGQNQFHILLRWLPLQSLTVCETVVTDRLWTSCCLPYKRQDVTNCTTGPLLTPAGHHASLQRNSVCMRVCSQRPPHPLSVHVAASTSVYVCIMVCVCKRSGDNRWCERGKKGEKEIHWNRWRLIMKQLTVTVHHLS